MYDYISKTKLSSLVAVDLTKAFDTVNHKILLEKLDYYGIRGICNDLIRSYLSKRQQKVYIAQESSTMRLVKFGVPQGSVYYVQQYNYSLTILVCYYQTSAKKLYKMKQKLDLKIPSLDGCK